MVIEELISNLPKNKKSIERAYDNCCKGKKFIEVKKEDFSIYLEKAKNDLLSVKSDLDNSSWDWAIIKCYYSIHHAINALLVKKEGFYSKDHICAILALNRLNLIPLSFYKRLQSINVKFSDFVGFELTYSLRKIGQYDVLKWKELSEKDAKQIYALTKEFVSFVEEECYK